MPESESVYDAIVIGSGPSGRTASVDLARNGLSVALIEAELVGGDCAYWACVPSKALLRPPEALNEARSIEGAAQAIEGRPVNARSVLARRDRFVDNWDDANMQKSLEKKGVKVIHGHGALAGQRRVVLKTKEGIEGHPLVARHAVILSTGSSTAFPEISGLAESNPWNSRNATGTHEVPESLAILGMGPVACEMATAMSALGTSEITLIGREERLLSRNEPFVGERLAQAFLKRGINVLTNKNVRRVTRVNDTKDSPFEVSLDDGSKITSGQLLVATGRQPNTGSLGLESVGLKSGAWLDVDDDCLVKGVEGGGEWLYAIGDINHRALLTHVGKYQGRACAAAIVARARDSTYSGSMAATSDHDMVPQVVFTDPEVAAVGLTEKQARERGLEIRVVDCGMDDIPGAALHTDGYSGHARLIVDEQHRVIIGATFIGPEAGDLVHAATVAIVGKVPLERLWHAIPCFPTVNEVWVELLESYGR
jgi:pyruvate/2-oxoglutarate dehydrogenase complex dihydrolipoamide dehydrogenase (E3) component